MSRRDVNSQAVLVRCRQVARTFSAGPSAVVGVYGIDCDVHRGEQVAVTGRSGSGKSTLLHLLGGLDHPTIGTITWPALGDPPALRPSSVAVVFQGPALVSSLDVLENVALPLVLGAASEDEAARRALVALERLGLESLATSLPHELSGGQLQQVAVARALAGEPRLILADEPTGQLDSGTARVVLDALVDSSTCLGAGLVITTHDPHVAERAASRWEMTDGRLVVAS